MISLFELLFCGGPPSSQTVLPTIMASYTYFALAALYASALLLARLIWLGWKGFTGPLRAIPGPWYAKLTNWRLKWAVLSGGRVQYIHSLHQKYGPIVRISPDEVAVADAASFREIYRVGSGFNKTDWYYAAGENENNVLSIFNMTDPKVHAARRRLLSKGFSQRLLREHWEATVKERTAFAIKRMKEDAAGNSVVDVLRWWTFMTTDIASALSFGESFHMLELGYKVPFVDALQKALIQITLCWEVPLLYRFMKLLPIASLQPIMTATQHLQEQGSKAVRESKARGISKDSIFAGLLTESEKDGAFLTDEDLRVEAGNFIIAGSDTTANTLTYLTWAVLKRPKLQQELASELDSVQGMSDENLEKLPILNAVIEESLRLYGALPSTLPRRTPYGGITLHGHYLPEGTIVGTQTYSLHRNPDVFPDPERFDHTRYLPTSNLSPVAKASFAPFSAGSAACLGIHLARMELRMAAAMFFADCRNARLSPSTTDEAMEMENFFIITPKGHGCEVMM